MAPNVPTNNFGTGFFGSSPCREKGVSLRKIKLKLKMLLIEAGLPWLSHSYRSFCDKTVITLYSSFRDSMTKKRMAWLEPCFNIVAERPL